jgi:hypothetical protein
MGQAQDPHEGMREFLSGESYFPPAACSNALRPLGRELDRAIIAHFCFSFLFCFIY